MELLERASFLDMLAGLWSEVRAGTGRTVLVSGEAGIGKTMLVEGFTARHRPGVRVLWGACDALFTPRPLGPLHDIARQTRGDLLALIETEAGRASIFSAFLDTLGEAVPTITVFEDVHWADDATLDLLKFLGRRIHQTRTLLIATYRDDEVGLDHPLRSVLGDLPRRSTNRLPLPALSEHAVETLARQAGRSVEGLYAATGGNPFFVTEILASRSEGVPITVRDAVLARAARLSPEARAVLEVVSVVPARTERWLLEALLHPEASAVEACIEGGMLRLDGDALAFRHELARKAVEDAVPAVRRRLLHTRVLEALLRRETDRAPIARIVHHADRAGNREALLRFAPAAAKQAAALNAHREAAAHYQTALRYADALSPDAQAALLEGRSYECYLTDQIDEALAARRAALEIRKQTGDALRQGEGLRWMSRLHWFLGRKIEAERYAVEAVTVLEALPPGPELAMAYSNRAQLHMLAEENAEAVHWGQQAIALAERFGALETLAHALNNVGSALFLEGDETGRADLEKSLGIALAHGFQEHAARAYTNLAASAVRHHDYATARSYLSAGIAYATERDLDSWRLYMTAWRARNAFEQGDWTSAAEDAARVLAPYRVAPITKIPALAVLGHVRIRRGDPNAAELLDEALALARETREIQRIAPVAAARAEAAWWRGRPDAVLAEARPAFDLARMHGSPWTVGELGYWMWRAGGLDEPPAGAAEPYLFQMAGDWQAAADAWARLGCPYEQARALADGDSAARQAALETFDALGARPAADRLREELRAQGIRGIRRGPRPTTRSNPAGLTARQMEVLALLAEGLTNAEIAGRLSISPKTVDHHISAVLAKLEAPSRQEAAARAFERGLLNDG